MGLLVLFGEIDQALALAYQHSTDVGIATLVQ
jgi:hypothetical protein